MATENRPATRTPGGSQTPAEAPIPLVDILYRTLHHWPWVLLSLAVCMSAGVLYLLCKAPIYTTTASLLIKDDTKGGTSGLLDEFADMGFLQNKTNIQNEISTLKSPDLMTEVVERLDLDMSYHIPGLFHNTVAYGTTLPVSASLPELAGNSSASFDLSVTPEGKVGVSSLEYDLGGGGDRVKADGTFTGTLSDTISTPAGPVVVRPTQYYTNVDGITLRVSRTPVAAVAESYEERLKVDLSEEKSTVVNLSVTDQSTERAENVLNTLIAIYNESWIRDKNQIAISTSDFINERLGVIEGELGNVDSDISSYKSEHMIPDVMAASAMYMDQNQRIANEILELNNQLQVTRYIRSYLLAHDGVEDVLPANTGVRDADLEGQINEFNRLILQRKSLSAKSSDKNPLVVTIDGQLRALRGAIIATIDNGIVALNGQIRNLQSTQAATTSKIASNPTQAKYLLSVERQQKVKEALYLFLLQKREENELSQAFTAYNTRVVTRPSSKGPTSPNRRNVLAMSFLAGLLIPFAVIYVHEVNNTRVRGRKDVEGLAIPLLGEIPQHSASDSRQQARGRKLEVNSIVVRPGKRDIINEAFRVLRTNAEFMCGSGDGHSVIALTSFNPGSGKSFISVNLAMSLALKGRKVLVIDGDMRHGSTSSYVGSPDRGLSNYLSVPGTDIAPLIVTDQECPTLDFLPVGTIPPNPTELLESPRFAELMAGLRTRYDYILVDCPPIEVVADAQIIDRYADRTFFIIRAGLLERSMLPELDRLYEEKKYASMSLILNGTRNDQGRYGYSHSYRYGYGYGYGYGYNYGEGKQ